MSEFDEVVNRKGTMSLKWDAAHLRDVPEDAFPMWVADMDFRTPEPVRRALIKEAEHGIFGYSVPEDDFNITVAKWFNSRFNVNLSPEWIVRTPGVVFAINMAIMAFTSPGDAVMIQQPVYYPFASSIINNNRRLVNNELVYHGGVYSVDFEDFEKKIEEEDVRLFILCSPHNPVGRVWSREELVKMTQILIKHHVFIISDEIHCDFTGDKYPHTMLPSLSEEVAQNCMLCTSPSKTFNLAGLQLSNIFIPSKARREIFRKTLEKTGYDESPVMGLVACRAAYEEGGEWVLELKNYINSNIDFVRNFIKDKLPMLHLVEPQGTYLIWIDFSLLGMTDEELDSFIKEKARLWLDGGKMFGDRSGQFQRFNLACPKSCVESAFVRLYEAVTEYCNK